MANGGQPMNDRELLLDTHKEVKFLKRFVEEHFTAGEKRMEEGEKELGKLKEVCSSHHTDITLLKEAVKKMPTMGKIIVAMGGSLGIVLGLFELYSYLKG